MSATDPFSAPGHDLSPDQLALDVDLLTALGAQNPLRGAAVDRPAEDGRGVCEIETGLEVSQGAVSQAISYLTDAGLLTRRKEGRWRYYDATARADRLLATLDGIRERDDE